MKHPYSHQELFQWVDGELPEGLAHLLQQHVASCDECKSEIELLRAQKIGIQTAGDFELNPMFAHDVVRATREVFTEEMSWEGVEITAKHSVFALAALVILLMIALNFEFPEPALVADQSFSESSDTLATHVMLKRGDLSKDDVMFTVLSK